MTGCEKRGPEGHPLRASYRTLIAYRLTGQAEKTHPYNPCDANKTVMRK